MKKHKSAVWRFFERVLDEDDRCIGVVCKLCETQYKFFGNTTNLRVHLINKHPIQWELSESGNLDETAIQDAAAAATVLVKTEARSARKKKYGPRTDKNVGYSVSIDSTEDSTSGATPIVEIQRVDVLGQNSDSDQEDEATTMNMVRQMHGEENSAEEWLEEDPYQITHIETFEPKPKRRRVKYRKIKREIQSPTDLPGFYVAPKPEKIIYEEPHSRKDEYSIFGEYVANKLRKLRAPRTRGNLQQLITTLLWQAEYGVYDSAEAVKRVLMISVPVSDQETESLNYTINFEHANKGPVIDTTDLSQSNEDVNAEQLVQ